MSTSVKAANANAVVTTGWTSPTNAYAADSTNATAAPGKNATVNSDFKFPNFTSSDIPDNAIIDSVTMSANTYTGNATYLTNGILCMRSGYSSGSEATTTSVTTTTIITATTAAGITLADLRSASTVFAARVRATKGSTNTAYTSYLNYVYITVTYHLQPGGSINIDAVIKKTVVKASGTFKSAANLSLSTAKFVAISKDSSVVAIIATDTTTPFTARLHILSGTNWATETILLPAAATNLMSFASDTGSGTTFGCGPPLAISADGSVIAVWGTSSDGYGHVYVYSGTSWGTLTSLSPSDGVSNDGAAISMSDDGATIVAGASFYAFAGKGEAYVFSGTNWATEVQLKPPDGQASPFWGYFGASVSISGDASTVVVGSPGWDPGGNTKGKVYVYSGTSWGTLTQIVSTAIYSDC